MIFRCEIFLDAPTRIDCREFHFSFALLLSFFISRQIQHVNFDYRIGLGLIWEQSDLCKHIVKCWNGKCAVRLPNKTNKNQATDKMRKKRQTGAHPYTAHWWDGVFACLNWAKIYRREYKRNDNFILACLLSSLMSRVLPHSIFYFQSLWIWTLASDVYKEKKSVGRRKWEWVWTGKKQLLMNNLCTNSILMIHMYWFDRCHLILHRIYFLNDVLCLTLMLCCTIEKKIFMKACVRALRHLPRSVQGKRTRKEKEMTHIIM